MEEVNKEHERVEAESDRVPMKVSWEIQDLVRPITLRRKTIWQFGAGVLALLGIGAVLFYFFYRAPSGDDLLANMIEAAGGENAWYAVDEGRFTRLHYVYDENENVIDTDEETFYFRNKDGYRMMVESDDENGHILIGYDDNGYWATKDGRKLHPATAAKELDMMCDSDFCTPLCAAEMALYRFAMPFKMADPGLILSYAGENTVNGVPTRTLDVTFEEGVGQDRWVLHADAETNLIRRIDHYASADGSTPPETVFWSDYRTENDIQISHSRTYYRSNGTKLEEYVISEVDFSSPLPPEVFARP